MQCKWVGICFEDILRYKMSTVTSLVKSAHAPCTCDNMTSDLLNGSFQDGNVYKRYISAYISILFVCINTVSNIISNKKSQR